MKKSKTLFKVLAAASLAVATFSYAVETDTVGYKTVTIKGDGSLNLIGIEFLETAAFTGPVSSVSETSISISGQDFNALLETGENYFLEVASGPGEGVNTLVREWSGETVTTVDDISSVLLSDSPIVNIHRLKTVGEVFGVGGDVLEGGSALTGDLILMPNPNGAGLIRLYYSSGGFTGTGWRQVGESGDRADTPIYFSDGLYIFKRSVGDVELVFSGLVKTTSSSVVIDEGFVPYSTVFASDTTLESSGLYVEGDPSKSISAGSAITADLVFTDSDGDGSIERYYYSNGGFTGTGWRQVGGSGDKANVELSSGFAVFKRSPGAIAVDRSPSY